MSAYYKEEHEQNLAKYFAGIQNRGDLAYYGEKAQEVAKEYGVAFCDIYGVWNKMYENGVDITELLANKYNHPIRELHYYTAIKIVETMFDV